MTVPTTQSPLLGEPATLDAASPTPRTGLTRRVLVVAWSTGPAAAYALLSLVHAGLVERVLTVDVGFGRSLAFWVLNAYLALGLWGFLPREPRGRYARPPLAYGALAMGGIGLLVCGGFTLAWLVAHWSSTIALPVLGSLVVMIAAAVATLRIADWTEPGTSD